MGFKEIAQDVVKYLGGKENISSVAHCATRLRVMVKDEAKIDKEAIENTDKVMGAFFNSGQYQNYFLEPVRSTRSMKKYQPWVLTL